MQTNLRLEYLDPVELRENPFNYRTHPANQTKALSDVISEVGWAGALLYNEKTQRLVDGHCRLKIAAGEKVPVLIGSWTEEQEKLILATLDPISAMAGTDQGKLDELLSEISVQSEAVQQLLESMSSQSVEVIEDDPPEIQQAEEANTKAGDIWVLGDHRLLCGDSSDIESVQRLMDGEKATCIFTDPPYGVSIGEKNRFLNSFQKSGRCLEDIQSDDLPATELKSTLLPVFLIMKQEIMSDDCTLFVSAPQGGDLMTMMEMLKDAGLKVRHVLIWKKNQPTFSMGRLDYDYQHEPILLTWDKKHQKRKLNEITTSIWEIDREKKCSDHRLLIQSPIETFISGQKFIDWQDKGYFWADVREKSASEPNQDQATKQIVTYEVRLRYQKLSSDSRLLWSGRVLNIQGIIEDPRRTSITCFCVADLDAVIVFNQEMSGGIEIGGTLE